MYLFFYVYTLAGFLVRLVFNYRRVEQEGLSFFQSLETTFNGRFADKMVKEANRRQGIQQLYINDSFTQLYGRHTRSAEQRNNKLYFVLSSLYDDLIDQQEATIEEIDRMFQDPVSFQPRNFNEHVLIHVHLKLLEAVKDKLSYQELLRKMHAVQMESVEQFDPGIDHSRLLSITYRKGGYSLLMCRHYLVLPVLAQTDAVWYHLGAVIQMSNDLFDIYKDIQAGIHTYANRARSYQEIKDLYDNQVCMLRNSIGALPVKRLAKLRFSILLSLIPALGYVALDNVQRIQARHKGLASLKELPRKELIVDMEKPHLLIGLMRHSFWLGKPVS